MKLIALKIDVDTTQAISHGLPLIVPVLREHGAGATFFWSLGREKNGSFLRPLRFVRKVAGSSYIPLKRRYGFSALLAGSFKPSRNLAKWASHAVKELNAPAFEHGIRPAQRHHWQPNIMRLDAVQTRAAYDEAIAQFDSTFGSKPVSHAAVGWQINRTAFRLHQINQLAFASDCRGQFPFWPIVQGEYTRCPQIPVTLPMLEEMLPQMSIEQAIAELQQKTSAVGDVIHVFNIAADFDAQYAEQLGLLFAAWLEQGYQLVSLGAVRQALDLKTLPYHHVEMKAVDGRMGLLAMQAGVYP